MIESLETKRARWLICFLLAAVTVGLYWRVRSFEFLCYDDPDYVTLNYHIQRGITWPGVVWAFTSVHSSNWHPLTWMSHMLDFQIWGDSPAGHHFTNVVFHAANAALVFLVLMRLTGAVWRSALVAGFFAWHPLHVESVAWVAERKDVLSAFFWLLAMWTYTRYCEASRGNDPKPTAPASKAPDEKLKTKNQPALFYGLTLFFFTLGLLSKPMVVTLPFVLLLLDFWPLRRVSDINFNRATLRTWGGLIFEKLPFFVLTLLCAWITYHAQDETMSSLDQLPLDLRLTNAVVSYGAYIGKMLWPANLSVFYPHPGEAPVAQTTIAFVALFGLSIFSLWVASRHPYVTMGWFWFVGTLVPVIGIVQVGQQAMADRYTYLPLLGLYIAIIWAAADLASGHRIWQLILNGTALGALVGCVVIAGFQLRYWKNDRLLFTHARDVTDRNFLACSILASKLEASDPEEAIADYNQALAWKPNSREAMFGKGRALRKAGRPDEAMECFRAALRTDPRYPELHNSLGAILAEGGKFAEAESEYRQALEADPDFLEARLNLGLTLFKQRKTAEAIAEFKRVLAATPDAVEALVGIGSSLALEGQPNEALASYTEALRLQPMNVEANRAMGSTLAVLGRTNDAISYFSQALKTEPNDPNTHFQLGSVLSQAGRKAEAIQHYEAVLRVQPDSVGALNNLAWIKATSVNPDLRDGVEAVRLAERACEITKESQPFLLGTLAAALAEAGRFPEAVAAARKARDLATSAGLKDVAARNAELLALYEANRPCRE